MDNIHNWSHVAPLISFLTLSRQTARSPLLFHKPNKDAIVSGILYLSIPVLECSFPSTLNSLDYLLQVCIGCYFLTENYPDTLQYYPCSCFLLFLPNSSPLLDLVAFIAVFFYSIGQQTMTHRSNLVCHLFVNKVLLEYSNAHSFVHCLCTVYDWFLGSNGRDEWL